MLTYSLRGKGPRVLLLHGFLESKEMFQPMGLEDYFECLMIDLPGHGESTLCETSGSIADVAKEIDTILSSLNWIKMHIIGHSMGGYVALELCQIIDFETLTLFHSNFWEDIESKKFDRERVAKIAMLNSSYFIRETIPKLFLPSFRNSEFVKSTVESAIKMEGKAIANTSIAMRNRKDFTEWVHLNSKRVHFIQGQLDPIVTIDDALIKCENLENFYVLENCGHMGQIESPAFVIALLMEIIRLTEN
jgi:pimeloyl-ACP methyl ester carboxylesterase